MAKYLLVESKSPWESGDAGFVPAMARDLAAAGHDVTVYLVQNGVMPARAGARDGTLAELAGRVKVLADDFSLRERAIGTGALAKGVTVSGIDAVVDLLAAGACAVWH